MTQAVNLLANDADAGNFAQTARDAAANYRRGFPTAEECFFNELMEGGTLYDYLRSGPRYRDDRTPPVAT